MAPTASDLVRFGKKDSILAGFHTDLNFLTIHGRSRYPGLHVWARNTGKRIAVKIPEGNYLLVQAGKQLEHLTGGLVRAGFHEVVVNERTISVRVISFVAVRETELGCRSSINAKNNIRTALSFVSRRHSFGTCRQIMI